MPCPGTDRNEKTPPIAVARWRMLRSPCDAPFAGSSKPPPSSRSESSRSTPRWLIEAFVDFQIPEDLGEYAPITADQKKKILGLNAAKMYDIPVPAQLQLPSADEPAVGPRGADNLVGA